MFYQAEDFKKQAYKELKRWFGGLQKYDNAAELYVKAASKFKAKQDFKNAGECFEKAAHLYTQAGSTLDGVIQWKEAGKAFNNGEKERAQECYEQAIDYYQEENRFNIAANLYSQIAITYLKNEINEPSENDIRCAIEAYNKASQCYLADNDACNSKKKLIDCAVLLADLKEYKEAIQHFENVALFSIDDKLLRWSAKNYFFQAALCQLCLTAKNNSLNTARNKYQHYLDWSETFRNTREAELIESLIEAMMSGEVQSFNEAIQKYTETSQLDNWKFKHLLEVKKRYFETFDDEDPVFYQDLTVVLPRQTKPDDEYNQAPKLL